MNGLPWFRMYARFIVDPDIEELSFEDQRHYVFVLCMKCDGLLDKDFGDPEKRERAIARRLGLQGEAFTFARQRLIASGLVDDDWQPRSWSKLQFKSDHDGAERKRRSRKALKENENRDVTTMSRDSPTLEQSRAEQSRAEQSRVAAAQPSKVAVVGLDLAAWERFQTYRRAIRKSIKPASVLAAQRKLAGFGADQEAVVEQSIAQSWAGLFALKVDYSAKRHAKSSDDPPSAL
jgi:hypothetical protein